MGEMAEGWSVGGGGDTISSFSVWYPWSNSQNAQEDLVREIATTTHQLITRGTEVHFQWVPAHVCLPGNDSKRRIEQQKEEPRELTPQQWQWKSAWPMYICRTNQAGMEAVGGVPPNGHGQGVGRHLSLLQGRSLLPWNSNLPSLHHTLSARGHLEMHVRTDEVWVWNERLVSPRDVLRHLMFRPLPSSNHWLGNYTAWDCPCVQNAWQCATSVKDGASCGLQQDWSTPVHWQPTCSRQDHRLHATLSRNSG